MFWMRWSLIVVATYFGSLFLGAETLHAQSTIDTLNMRLMAQIGGGVNTVFVDPVRNLAYIGEGPRLTILDLTNPVTPTVMGRTALLPSIVKGVAAQGQVAYVTLGAAGLYLFDVSNHASPTQIGWLDTPGDASGIALAGTIAYVADGQSGLRLIDVSNPAAPIERGLFDTPDYAISVAVSGTIAYLADRGDGLRLVNVSNPAAPSALGVYDTPGAAWGVFVSGNLAYIADDSAGLRIVSVANPNLPVLVGSRPTSNGALDVVVRGAAAYVATGDGGLEIFNVNNPALPIPGGIFDTPGDARQLVVISTTVYLADANRGLRLVNVSTPVSPSAIGSYDLLGDVRGVAVVGNTAYAANSTGGLKVIDITDPTHPMVVGEYDTPGDALKVAAAGNIAYVADSDGGLQLVNVADPANPKLASTFNEPKSAIDVDIADNIAYVATFSGVRIVNVTNPAAPTQTSFFTTPSIVQGLFANGGSFYAAVSNAGMQLVYAFNPAAPQLGGLYDTPGFSGGVAVAGRTAYVADGAYLRSININSPPDFNEIGSFPIPGYVANVTVSGRTVYAMDTYNGVRMLNVANPATPAEIGYYKAPGFPGDVVVANGLLLLAQRWGGLYILRPCYKLSLQHTGSGNDPVLTPTKSANCELAGEFLFGDQVSLSATPNSEWQVSGWQGTRNDNSTSNNNLLTMPAADHQVTVRYAPTCYTLTLTHSGNGSDPTPTPANSEGCSTGQYVAGASLNLHATPSTGYSVGSWLGTLDNPSTAMDNRLTMPATNHTASVNYVLACYLISLTHSGNGSDPVATPAQSTNCPSGRYHYSDTLSLTVTPASGWLVAAWSGTTNNTLSSTTSIPLTNTVLMPPSDHTVTVHYSEIPVSEAGDGFELDNTCTRSRAIQANGSEAQAHTFHVTGDVDWLRFDGVAGSIYRIEVTVPTTSPADVIVEAYADCQSAPTDQWTGSFSPSARLDVKTQSSGPRYVRISNVDANVAGNHVGYEVRISNLSSAPSNRAVILVAGRLKSSDAVQDNIHYVAQNAYRLFQRNGYNSDTMRFLATDSTLVGYTHAASKANLQDAITTWAASRVTNGVLTLYMVDHGTPALFYLDEVTGQRITPSDLNQWLTQLEQAAPGVKINVIIEACESGSFIRDPGGISKPGRVIATSTSATVDAFTSTDGAYFSDHLITGLQQGYNLAASFYEARRVAQISTLTQDAWLDADGNGIPNEFGDSSLAAQRGFAYANTLGDPWPPHIFAVQPLTNLVNGSGDLVADVRDDVNKVRQVWAVVYPPSYVPPPVTQQLQPEVQPTFRLERTDTNTWKGKLIGLSESGTYRIILHAEDEDGLVARPLLVEVNTQGQQLFLPLARR